MAPPRKMRRIWRDCFQPLIERIHFNAHRFEGRYPQQRLGVRVAEDNRAADGRAKRGCDECIERVD